jgi:large subunit ribosomal protein L17
MLRNMVTSLFARERIRTTTAKAKEARRVAERMITFARRGDLSARRHVARTVNDPAVLQKLFSEIAPRYADRPGGYTRILKLGVRRGDAAQTAILELVGEGDEGRKKKKKARKKRQKVDVPDRPAPKARAEKKAETEEAPAEEPAAEETAAAETPETGGGPEAAAPAEPKKAAGKGAGAKSKGGDAKSGAGAKGDSKEGKKK